MVESHLRAIQHAIESYAETHGEYPETLRDLTHAGQDGRRYLMVHADDLRDPWGNLYVYSRLKGGSYSLVSLGRDGRRGGRGVDADSIRGAVAGPP